MNYESAIDATKRRLGDRKELDNFSEGLKELGEQTSVVLNRLESIVYGLEGAFEFLFMSVGRGWDNMLRGFINMIQQMIAKAAAAATVKFLINLLTGKTGGVLEAGLSAIGLAQGGVIPPGYPNDSYPAFLTSGETVTPVGQSAALGGQVRFVIEDDVLVGILNKYNNKNSIY